MQFYTNTSERMRIDSSGNVSIGATSAVGDLHVQRSGGSELWLGRTTNSGQTTALLGEITFGDTVFDSNMGGIKASLDGSTTSSNLSFYTQATSATSAERMRIDSSGNVLVGTTDNLPVANNDASGIALRADGNAQFSRSGAATARFNRGTSDGEIISFHKDGAAVGSINNDGANRLIVNSENTTGYLAVDGVAKFRWRTNDFIPHDDNTKDLGHTSTRWNDLYLGGGVFVGGTGDANKLDDYEEGTFTMGLDVAGGSPSFSISNTTGYYIKIGKLVHFNWYSGAISVTDGGSGNVSLTGLPFFSNSATNNYSVFQYVNGNAFSQTTAGGYINTNANNAFFIVQDDIVANVGLQAGTRYILVRGTYYSA
jgi:hypothetical protein